MAADGCVATIISFRLGGGDGVAIEARKWGAALEQLGFDVRRVAGQLEDGPAPDDVVLPGLRPEGAGGVDADAVSAAIAGSDLVVA